MINKLVTYHHGNSRILATNAYLIDWVVFFQSNLELFPKSHRISLTPSTLKIILTEVAVTYSVVQQPVKQTFHSICHSALLKIYFLNVLYPCPDDVIS